MKKPKRKNRKSGAAFRSSELAMLRRAELELHRGITNMRSLIDQLNSMQQIWARAADALKAAQHDQAPPTAAGVAVGAQKGL